MAHYVFVSSINAYPAWPEHLDYIARGAHDADPRATKDDVPAGVGPAESYGWLKVGCERAVAQAFGADRTTVLRAGAIVGPHDGAVGRLPWWLQRAARGGEILVPGSPQSAGRAHRRARPRPVRAAGRARRRSTRPARLTATPAQT